MTPDACQHPCRQQALKWGWARGWERNAALWAGGRAEENLVCMGERVLTVRMCMYRGGGVGGDNPICPEGLG